MSSSQALQVFGFGFEKIPRFILAIVSTIIYAVIAIAGRQRLIDIFEDLLSVIGYWVCAYFVVIFEEHFLFRFRRGGYDRDVWNSPRLLPRGIAAMLSFWIGIMGAFIGMSQTWFVGPLSAKFGPFGGDLGALLCSCFVAITYPVMRVAERKYFKV
jgi:purine-cytosine permease-like protein